MSEVNYQMSKVNYSSIRFHGTCTLFGGQAFTGIVPETGIEVRAVNGGFEFRKKDTRTNSMAVTWVPTTSVQSITHFEDTVEKIPKAND